jgi:hypothetical protein
MGGGTTPSRALGKAGQAFRSGNVQKGIERHTGFNICCCVTPALITQMSQTAVHRHHSVDQQLCRWPLLSLIASPQ